MQDLTLLDGGLTIKPFQITNDTDQVPMLYVETSDKSAEATLTFYRSTDSQTFTPHPETKKFTGYLHETLYGLKKYEFLKITSNIALLNPKIMW